MSYTFSSIIAIKVIQNPTQCGVLNDAILWPGESIYLHDQRCSVEGYHVVLSFLLLLVFFFLFNYGNFYVGRLFSSIEDFWRSVCLDAKFMPEGSMPYILLISFPGSGNTWVRYLIERATGIYTGSVGNDPTLHEGGRDYHIPSSM